MCGGESNLKSNCQIGARWDWIAKGAAEVGRLSFILRGGWHHLCAFLEELLRLRMNVILVMLAKLWFTSAMIEIFRFCGF